LALPGSREETAPRAASAKWWIGAYAIGLLRLPAQSAPMSYLTALVGSADLQDIGENIGQIVGP
jgi:hypothetical protein